MPTNWPARWDLFEALDAVKREVSRRRKPHCDPRFPVWAAPQPGILPRNYAGEWAAAAPGAGFAETPQFLRVFRKKLSNPTWWEQKLWHMYDATDYGHQPVQLPAGRLQRRNRYPETGRRCHG